MKTKTEELAIQEAYAAGLAEGIEKGKRQSQVRCIEILEIPLLKNIQRVALSYIRDTTFSSEEIRLKLLDGGDYDDLINELVKRGLNRPAAQELAREEFPRSFSVYVNRLRFGKANRF